MVYFFIKNLNIVGSIGQNVKAQTWAQNPPIISPSSGEEGGT
jgi:hypothetical protein